MIDFGGNILGEFNMEQIIFIHDKENIQNDDILESGLVTSRSNTTLKEYHQSFPEFLDILKKAASKSDYCSPLNVDLDMSAVDQMWYMVK